MALNRSGSTDHQCTTCIATTIREVKATVDTPFDGGHAIIWGAEEIPSGLTINPEEPAGTVVEATG